MVLVLKPKAGGHTKVNGHVDSRAVMESEVAPLLEQNMKVNSHCDVIKHTSDAYNLWSLPYLESAQHKDALVKKWCFCPACKYFFPN